MSNNGWMPIESAPKDGHDILLSGLYTPFQSSCQFAGVFIGAWDVDVEGWMVLGHDDAGQLIYANPTHWQPLPPPPGEAA